MPRNYKVYLLDILEAISNIRDYTRGFSLNRFAGDRKTVDAGGGGGRRHRADPRGRGLHPTQQGLGPPTPNGAYFADLAVRIS